MKIGELAARTGCQAETIRFYEQRGLLPAPCRSSSNYRLYGEVHVARLTFIRRCRALGMSLGEVQALLGLQDQPDQPCCGVNQLVDRHLEEIGRQIDELQALRKELTGLRSRCDRAVPVRECEILRGLASAAPAR